MTAQEVIDRLRLVPLTIEGGYFRETYRSELSFAAGVLPGKYGSPRSVATAIYYLITADTFSEMHRVASDELFHFYAGDRVEMLQLHEDGRSEVVFLGNDLAAGDAPQVVTRTGLWYGCWLVAGGEWALMGCTVAPGFEYADYTRGNRAELIAKYPAHEELITALTRV